MDFSASRFLLGATSLLFVVKHSKQVDLQAKVNRILQENHSASVPVRLKGRQLLKVIILHYESEKDRGTAEALDEFMDFQLVNGHEREYLDRWDQFIRDLGEDCPGYKVLQLKFHKACLRSDLMRGVNKEWGGSTAGMAETRYSRTDCI